MSWQPGFTGVLWFLIGLSLASGTHYVQTGSAIEACDMKCPHREGVLELYRICRGNSDALYELLCYSQHSINYYKERLRLDTSSGCWSLSNAGKGDSCVYETEFYSSPIRKLSSQEFHVLDPVLISNISSNSSRLGEDIAVSVHYSGEESAVTWELEGARLLERYRLIDDNRTLIIPSVQRGDSQRRFRVTVTNPVSEETRDYELIMEQELKEEEGSAPIIIIGVLCGVLGIGIVLGIIFVVCYWKRERPIATPEAVALNGLSAITPNDVPASSQDVMVSITNDGPEHDLTSDASTGA